MTTLLSVRNVVREFAPRRSFFRPASSVIRAVDGVSLDVVRGRTLGIVGESGSGKTTLARMMVGLLAPTSGEIALDGASLPSLLRQDRRAFYRRVQMVFQHPAGSLNPRKTVRQSVEAPLAALTDLKPAARRERADELLWRVGLLPGQYAGRYPHELSGGEAQRVAVARALAAGPALIVLDEPVSSLDVVVQAQVLALLRQLRTATGITLVFISHDVTVIETMADDVAVMRAGKVVESGPAPEVLRRPQHAYTQALLAAVPRLPLPRRA
jgi:peptide/nickel transport system ATP-binding protein